MEQPEFSKKLDNHANVAGNLLVEWFHIIGLFTIGGAIVWSAVVTFIQMMKQDAASIEDILLLFIYLELGAMVGIYFRTKKMPVTFLLYVAITALTRLITGLVSNHAKPDMELLIVVGSIFVLAISVVILKYGSAVYPSQSTRGRKLD